MVAGHGLECSDVRDTSYDDLRSKGSPVSCGTAELMDTADRAHPTGAAWSATGDVCQMQRLLENADIELMRVIVSSRSELDTRTTEKTESEEKLQQEIQQLMIQLPQKCVEIVAAISTISSMQAASSHGAHRLPQQRSHD